MSAIPVRRDNLDFFSPSLFSKIIGLSLVFMLLLGLIVQAQAAQVTLAWDANSESDLSGYKLYYGTSSGNYSNTISLGKVTTYTVTNLTEGVTYYFALTAFDTEGFESAKSNEVSYTLPASQFTLTVSKNGTGGGTVTNAPTGTSFNAGTAVTLTAAADANSNFTGWTGACTGTTNPCTVTMNANTTVTAAFALKTYTITASAGTGGSISPSGGINVNSGASQTFTITPNTGYQIAGVTVDGVAQGTPGSYSFSNVIAAHTIQATFAANPTYTLTVSKNGTGGGTVTNAPTGTSFNAGTAVTLTAAADANSNFTGWTGACTGTTNPCTVTMNANTTVTAAFALKTYTITASAGTGGSISPSGGINVNSGASQTFTITPNTGYQIAGVTVDGVAQGTPGSYSFSNVIAAHTIQATFAANPTYTLTVSKNGTGGGAVTNAPTGTSFNAGTAVTLTAAADANSNFTGWTGACTGTTNPCTVTMNANTTVTAAFALKTYTITASAGTGGSISPSGGINVNSGASQTFTITPNTGYQIAGVTVDGVAQGTPGSYSFSNVIAAHTIQATFAANPTYTLTVSKNGTGSGTVTNAPTGTSFNAGTAVTLTAAADANSNFTGWTGACTGTTNPCTVTMNANTTVTAAFALKTYTITASAGTGGSISPSGGINVNSGASQTFTITPNTGYQIAGVTVDGVAQGTPGSYSFSNVIAAHTIQATFAANPTYTLTVSKNGTGGGTVTNAPTGTSFNAGTAVTLTAAADANSNFTGWTGACTGTTNPCTVTMNANTTVTAAFALKTYTITASAGTGGSISPSGGINVNSGASQTFTITPNTGYQIAGVTVDGVAQGTPGSYSFSNVIAAHTIQATFAANPTYTLTVSKNGTGSGAVTNAPTGTSFNAGTAVTLTAAADANSNFTGWTGACTGTTNPCTVTMNANTTVTAAFALKTYTITASAGTGGSISPSGGINVNSGASQTFTITPNTGYRIYRVRVDGVSQGTPGSYSFSNVITTHTIQATFTANPTYTLTISKNGTGSGTVTGTGISCGTDCNESLNANTSVSLTALADTNSTFAGWTGACSGTTNPCTVTISANTSIQANFNLETNKPTSSISNPANGSTWRHPAVAISGGATDGSGSGVQKVEVSTDGGATWKPADGTILWNYSWTAPGNGTYVIKSRATDNVGNVENPGVGVTVTVASYQPTPVNVSGKQLLVNGAPFTVKGVVYSPVPIGEDPNNAPFGDYFTAPYSAIYNRDLPVLKAMGANVVRLYNWEKSADHFDFLDQAYNDGSDPIYVIAGYWINDGLDIDPASPANVRDQIKADFQKMVAAHKDHPAILMWSVGQNLNLPQAYGNSLPQLFSLINELAEVAHLEEGTKAHPVTTALADQNLAATLAGFEEAVPALDIWGANVYRGNSFGTLFADSSPATTKPVLILEYGIDAFDNTRGNEYEKSGKTTQADITEGLWKEIAANNQTCVGGTIMSYSDEWWKGRYSGDTSCPADPDPALHGSCGFATTSQPDGYANEEWWGIVRVLDNGTSPDKVEPRAVYSRLQYLWGANTLALTSPNGGESWQAGKPQTIDWNYAGNPSTSVKIDLLKNGSVIRNIVRSAKIGANGSGSYTWTPPSKLKPGSDYQIRITSIGNNGINDTSDANFNINSYHFMTRLEKR